MSKILGIDTDNYAVQSLKSTGGGSATLQSKSVTITDNGTTNVQPDTGYDGLSSVAVTTNVTPNLQNKSVTITENTTTTIQADTGYDGLSSVAVITNVSGGADLSKYFSTSISEGTNNAPYVLQMIKTIPEDTVVSGDKLLYAFQKCYGLESLPMLDTSNVINMGYLCQSCSKLKTFPLWNTEKVFSFYQAFSYCSNLENVPVLDTRAVTNFTQMFLQCPKLTNESLNNIMQMCINASAYTGTKSLAYLGLTSTQATTCQSLSNYQAFINAGWTTGY